MTEANDHDAESHDWAVERARELKAEVAQLRNLYSGKVYDHERDVERLQAVLATIHGWATGKSALDEAAKKYIPTDLILAEPQDEEIEALVSACRVAYEVLGRVEAGFCEDGEWRDLNDARFMLQDAIKKAEGERESTS